MTAKEGTRSLNLCEGKCGAGIKREGLLYLEKYGTGGPEFGIKEFVTERGRQLFHARA